MTILIFFNLSIAYFLNPICCTYLGICTVLMQCVLHLLYILVSKIRVAHKFIKLQIHMREKIFANKP